MIGAKQKRTISDNTIDSTRTGGASSITILIATCNRPEPLRATIGNLSILEREGLDIELVVVENGQAQGVEQIMSEEPIPFPYQYLYYPLANKSLALNHAIDNCEMKELVVFTDDDIHPAGDWLQKIVAISNQWPDFPVFGGKCRVLWPQELSVPAWARSRSVIGWAYGSNEDIGDTEKPYPSNRYPVGFNFWVRRWILDEGRRFDGGYGPKADGPPTMGQETAFLMMLQADGLKTLYAANAVVEHRIVPEAVSSRAIRKRAAAIARTGALMQKDKYPRLHRDYPLVWRAIRLTSFMLYTIRYSLAWCIPFSEMRTSAMIRSVRGLTYNAAVLRQTGTPGMKTARQESI